uniref:Uncharacterized protein n=1 Tax=Craspedostauros australis TaxID=1486917 RepID=A0A7R9WN41_9STRA
MPTVLSPLKLVLLLRVILLLPIVLVVSMFALLLLPTALLLLMQLLSWFDVASVSVDWRLDAYLMAGSVGIASCQYCCPPEIAGRIAVALLRERERESQERRYCRAADVGGERRKGRTLQRKDLIVFSMAGGLSGSISQAAQRAWVSVPVTSERDDC